MTAVIHAKVTKVNVDRLQVGETIRDTDLKGFGARCQYGAPSYFLQKKIQGRVRWFTIGPHGAPWTPETARKEANRLLYSLSSGVDPHRQRQLTRDKVTTREAADQFLAVYGPKLKPRTRSDYANLFRLYILPAFGSRKISELTKSDIASFHAKLAHIPAAANYALAVTSKLCSWCEDIGHRPDHSNPCRGVKKFRSLKQERFLSLDELRKLGDVLDRVEADGSAGLFAILALRLLVLTGARLSEILTLQWAHVDITRSLVFLPDSKTGKKPLRLSAPSIALLEAAPRVAGNPYVIVGHIGMSHLVNIHKPWYRIRAMAGLDGVRIHDLRHTFASLAAASGASLPMIGKLLGHTQPQTTARYAHLAEDPIHQLNNQIGNVIADALTGAAENTLAKV